MRRVRTNELYLLSFNIHPSLPVLLTKNAGDNSKVYILHDAKCRCHIV